MKALSILLVLLLIIGCGENEVPINKSENDELILFCATAAYWHSQPQLRIIEEPLRNLQSEKFTITRITNNQDALMIEFSYIGECTDSKLDFYIQKNESNATLIELDAKFVRSDNGNCETNTVDTKELYDLRNLESEYKGKSVVLNIENWVEPILIDF